MKRALLFILPILWWGCKDPKPTSGPSSTRQNISLDYAEGFKLIQHDGFVELVITRPWPEAEESFRYALTPDPERIADKSSFDAVVKTPVKDLVVTSTTHIPSLEMLDCGDKLIGFPNLDYISSSQTRERIRNGQIAELGKNEALNTELLLELQPDVLVTFAVNGGNKAIIPLEQAGIPVLYNADWTETHPLGKAEWIKFFGVLLGKERTADSVFNIIEERYERAAALASTAKSRPTVISGALYKDVWYLPAGESWAARFLEDARGDYLWRDSPGSGSLSLSLESVLEKGQNADIWIGPGQFDSQSQMAEAHAVYTEFKAFNDRTIYTFTALKGATGGVIYYELAPNRPDLVLEDMIHILHPELLPDHQLYFFRPLEE
jgi:iron complex transport system substrate-binding protein